MKVMWPVVLAHEGNVLQIHEYANPDTETTLKITSTVSITSYIIYILSVILGKVKMLYIWRVLTSFLNKAHHILVCSNRKTNKNSSNINYFHFSKKDWYDVMDTVEVIFKAI
jgi:hypothetical protein